MPVRFHFTERDMHTHTRSIGGVEACVHKVRCLLSRRGPGMARWPGRAETHREKAAFLFACIKSTAFSLLRKPKNTRSALPFPQLVSRAGRGSRRLQGTSSRLLLRVAPTAQASPTLSVSNVSIMPGRRLHQSLPRVYNASDQNKTKTKPRVYSSCQWPRAQPDWPSSIT